MNERIKELAEQARHWAHFDGLVQNPKSSPDILFEQKFAEMMVQEFIKLADEEEDRFLCMGELDLAYAMANFQLLVKNHFEVKE